MSDDRAQRLRDACTQLTREGQPVTFTAAAVRAEISRATLYRHRPLREIVDAHRASTSEHVTVTGLADQIDQLRHTLEALAAKTQRHEEQLRRLNRP